LAEAGFSRLCKICAICAEASLQGRRRKDGWRKIWTIEALTNCCRNGGFQERMRWSGGFGRRFLRVHNGFWHCAHNGEKRCLGFEAVCFRLKQLVSDCPAIVHHCAALCAAISKGKKLRGAEKKERLG
jgi:hypothetical protein